MPAFVSVCLCAWKNESVRDRMYDLYLHDTTTTNVNIIHAESRQSYMYI